MCSLTIDWHRVIIFKCMETCARHWQNVFSYYRMCYLTIDWHRVIIFKCMGLCARHWSIYLYDEYACTYHATIWRVGHDSLMAPAFNVQTRINPKCQPLPQRALSLTLPLSMSLSPSPSLRLSFSLSLLVSLSLDQLNSKTFCERGGLLDTCKTVVCVCLHQYKLIEYRYTYRHTCMRVRV